MKSNLAPVVLFVYNRLDHTKKTIEALRQAKTHDKVKDVSAITDRLDRALEVVQRYAQRQYRLEGKTL